MTACHMW